MVAAVAAIPYEKQIASEANRTCGAACLSMVYRSLGKQISQDEIWPAISKPGPLGGLASTTHLMAQDAVNRGFHAVVIQARHPLQVLRLCREWGIRGILNHSLQKGSRAGHYSVLVGLNDTDVVLHDPLFGPARRLGHAELMALWQPQVSHSEIPGNVIIGIAGDVPTKDECEFCHTPIPSRVDCPRCQKAVMLAPGALLGCMRDGCIARMWNYLCCPVCDCMWTFSLQPGAPVSPAERSAAVPSASETNADPWKLGKFFGELDKFCAFAGSLGAVTESAEIRQQLDFIAGSKERLKLAQAEELARIKAQHEKLDARRKAAEREREARRKQLEERNKPLPPLDPNLLGQDLLRNLGLLK